MPASDSRAGREKNHVQLSTARQGTDFCALLLLLLLLASPNQTTTITKKTENLPSKQSMSRLNDLQQHNTTCFRISFVSGNFWRMQTLVFSRGLLHWFLLLRYSLGRLGIPSLVDWFSWTWLEPSSGRGNEKFRPNFTFCRHTPFPPNPKEKRKAEARVT